MSALSPGEFAQFNGLLASAVDRHLPLEPVIGLLAAQIRGNRLRRALRSVAGALQEGTALEVALAAHPSVFPAPYTGLLAAAQRDGRLAEALRYVETDYVLRARAFQKARGLLLYFLVGFLVFEGVMGIIGLLFSTARGFIEMEYWSPQFTRMEPVFLSPLRTALLTPWFPMAAVAALFGLALGILFVAGKLSRQTRLGYLIPLWGGVEKNRDLAYLCTTVALRLRAGAPVGEAFQEAAESLGNHAGRRSTRRVGGRVSEGEPLSSALFYDRFFPRTLSWAVSMGEARGEIPAVFDTFARIYTTQMERAYGMLLEFLGPLSMLILGNLVIGSFLLLWLPVYVAVMQIQGNIR